jgi:hypothetical protein
MAVRGAVGDAPAVDPDTSVAETLPRVYRRVLDAVARLEALGARRDATRFRNAAIEVYSRAWDARCHRRLEEILVRAEALADDRPGRTPTRVA